MDAKHPPKGRTVYQSASEWAAYERAVRALALAAGLPLSRVLDVRGNHDTYTLGAGHATQADYFVKHSATALAGRDATARVHAAEVVDERGDGWRYRFVGLDASQRADAAGPLTRALNFFGDAVATDLAAAAAAQLAEAHAANASAVAYAHYPLSFMRGGMGLRRVLEEGGAAAYLCGHIHALFGERVRARRQAGLWEMELPDWKANRALRVIDLEGGRVVAAADVRWPLLSRLGGAAAGGDGGGDGGREQEHSLSTFAMELFMGLTGIGMEGTPDVRGEAAAKRAAADVSARPGEGVALMSALATEYILHAAVEDGARLGTSENPGAGAFRLPSVAWLALDVDWHDAALAVLRAWQCAALACVLAPRCVALARRNTRALGGSPSAAVATGERGHWSPAAIWDAQVRSAARTYWWALRVWAALALPWAPWFEAAVDIDGTRAWVAPTYVRLAGGVTVTRHEGVVLALPHLFALWLPGLLLVPLTPGLAAAWAKGRRLPTAALALAGSPLLAYHVHAVRRAASAFGWRCVALSPGLAWTLPILAALAAGEMAAEARERRCMADQAATREKSE